MSLVLDSATEARIQAELGSGRYAAPDDLLNHALDLLEAERTDLTTRRAQIVAEIDESLAQLDRGEFVTEDQLRARITTRRAVQAGS